MYRRREDVKKLYEAAEEGNTTSLKTIIEQDDVVLDKFVSDETPLHIAATAGHQEFATELLTRKPELAQVLDSGKRSPLHLATANGHLNLVKALLVLNPDMCLVQDRLGRNPLHIAVVRGQIDILKLLVRTKPEAVRLCVDRDRTILHLCVKYNQLEALEFLMGRISEPEFVNVKDEDGRTALHLAVAKKEVEITEFLITKTKIDVNALNANGFTALDTNLAATENEDPKDERIKDLLLSVGGTTASSLQVNKWLQKEQWATLVAASMMTVTIFWVQIQIADTLWQDKLHETRNTFFLICDTICSLVCLSLILISAARKRVSVRRFLRSMMVDFILIAVVSAVITYLVCVRGKWGR